MTINEAKNILEREIILWDGVIGIGIVNDKTPPEIEVTIDRNYQQVLSKVRSLIGERDWHGYNVRLHLVDIFRPYNS